MRREEKAMKHTGWLRERGVKEEHKTMQKGSEEGRKKERKEQTANNFKFVSIQQKQNTKHNAICGRKQKKERKENGELMSGSGGGESWLNGSTKFSSSSAGIFSSSSVSASDSSEPESTVEPGCEGLLSLRLGEAAGAWGFAAAAGGGGEVAAIAAAGAADRTTAGLGGEEGADTVLTGTSVRWS